MRNWAALAGTVAIAAMAASQDATSARKAMVFALTNLGASRSITIQSDGFTAEKDGGKAWRVSTVIEFANERGVPTAFLEQMTYRSGKLVHRLAADGRTLWTYDTLSKSYSSTPYQNDAPNHRTDYLRRMLLMASRWSPMEADFHIRLLTDCFTTEPSVGRWSPWLADSVPVLNTLTGQIFCTSKSRGELVYALDGVDPAAMLYEASFRKKFYSGSRELLTWWNAKIWANQTAPDTVYKFVPPRDARAKALGG